jgi:hypothetical protein
MSLLGELVRRVLVDEFQESSFVELGFGFHIFNLSKEDTQLLSNGFVHDRDCDGKSACAIRQADVILVQDQHIN